LADIGKKASQRQQQQQQNKYNHPSSAWSYQRQPAFIDGAIDLWRCCGGLWEFIWTAACHRSILPEVAMAMVDDI
jgi:hypothetical protein